MLAIARRGHGSPSSHSGAEERARPHPTRAPARAKKLNPGNAGAPVPTLIRIQISQMVMYDRCCTSSVAIISFLNLFCKVLPLICLFPI